MLVYLLFIFACGWCVCWLLFLNYQQYSHDSQRRMRRRTRSCSLRKRHRSSRHLIGGEAQDLEAYAEGSAVPTRARPLDSIVMIEEEEESRGRKWRLQPPAAQGQLELDCGDTDRESEGAPEFREDELEDLEEDGLDEAEEEEEEEEERLEFGVCRRSARCTCLTGQRRNRVEEVEFRGWPGGADNEEEDDFDPLKAANDHEDSGEEHQLWPIVELHENPLNYCQDVAQVQVCDDGGEEVEGDSDWKWRQGSPWVAERTTSQQNEGNRDGDEMIIAERSRLFSLCREQSDRRAAIRMVSRSR